MSGETTRCPQGWEPTRILAYLEGALDAKSAVDAERHIRTCPVCSGLFESLSHMHSLLEAHPEAFHPDEQELLEYAATGADPDGSISRHLETCPSCTEDVGLLSEMIEIGPAPGTPRQALPEPLKARLRPHGKADGDKAAARSYLAEFADRVSNLWRIPALGMGTAVAVIVLAVIIVPLYREASKTLGDLDLPEDAAVSETASPAPTLPAPADAPADVPEGRPTTKEYRLEEKGKLNPARKLSKDLVHPSLIDKGSPEPTAFSESEETLRSRRGVPRDLLSKTEPRGRRAQVRAKLMGNRASKMGVAPMPTRETFGKVEKPLPRPRGGVRVGAEPTASPGSVGREKQQRYYRSDPATTSKRAGGSSGVLPRHERSASTKLSVEAARDSAGPPPMHQLERVPVRIRIQDPNGRKLSWPSFTPPEHLLTRYRFLDSRSDDATRVHEERSALRRQTESTEGEPRRGWQITIVVARVGERFNLEGKIAGLPDLKTAKVIHALNVSRESVDSRVGSMIGSLLSVR